MIDGRVTNFGTIVNGWLLVPQAGVFAADYLLGAANTQHGLGANIAEEAFYPVTFTDSD